MIDSFFKKITEQTDIACHFGFVSDNKTVYPSEISCTEKGDVLHIGLRYTAPAVEEDIFLTRHAGNHCTAVRRFRNISAETLHLNELFCRFDNITFGGDPAEDYYYHVENPRLYSRFCMGVDVDHFQLCRDSGYDPESGNRWSDPGTIHKRVGRSPYQTFPAILLSNKGENKGLVHGTLSQKVFYHCYELDHDPAQSNVMTVFSAFKSIDYREVKGGEVLTDEWYLGLTSEAGDLEKIFSGYTAELRKKLPNNHGSSRRNRHTLVWGSWNDGVCWDIPEEKLLKTAQYIKDNFPTVEWFQVDVGYASGSDEYHYFHGLGTAYEGENGVDKNKFPEGLGSFFNKIREIGLRPALWIGGFCPKRTLIYQEHPEWFCNYDFRVSAIAPLDISKKEVRRYMESALDKMLSGYGAEGMKQDFWSYAFEEGNPILSGHERSGYEYRRWWLQSIRRHLAEDGYLQVACDIGMSNPFLGEFVNNFRYGIDIAHGEWENVKTTYQWGAACFALHTGDLYIPNSDGVGIFPGLNDSEALFCLNYCLVTGSMVEIAGYLHANADHPRMKYLRKVICCPNNGQEIFNGKFDYRHSDKAPDKFFFKGPFFSLLRGKDSLPLRTVGFFNLEDVPQKITATADELDLAPGKYLAWDIWNGKETIFDQKFSVDLPSHGSALYTIVPLNGKKQILDADLKISDIERTADGLRLTFAFAGRAQICCFDGEKVCWREFVSKGPGDTLLL